MDSSKNINFTICIVNYNKSQYLPFLFDSLLRQRDKNFCVLFVDNNSTDNSVEIAKNYAQKLRIEVLSEKKRGVQFARQAVLNNVKTEFFSFVDADDIVDCDYVSFINKNKAHCDLLIFGFKSFEDFNSFVKKNRPINPKIKTKIYQLKKPIYSFQKLMGIELTFLWNKVFRKSVCDHFSLSFDPEVSIGEDCLFIDKYLPHSSSIKVSDKLLYYYRKAEGSLTLNLNDPTAKITKIQIQAISWAKKSPSIIAYRGDTLTGTYQDMEGTTVASYTFDLSGQTGNSITIKNEKQNQAFIITGIVIYGE